MGKSLKEWGDNLRANKTPKEAEEILNAIETLKKWDAFRSEYRWTGIFTIGSEVMYQINTNKAYNKDHSKWGKNNR